MADNLRKYTTQEVLNKVYTDSSGITIGLNSQSSKETLNAVLDSSNNRLQVAIAGGTISGDVTITGDLTVNSGTSTLVFDESVVGDMSIKGADGGTLFLQTSDTDVRDNDVLGRIHFQAPDEANGSDAILVGASIHAEATSFFQAGDNPTDLVFSTGSSETATPKMRITSDGRVGIGNEGVAGVALSVTISSGNEIARFDSTASAHSQISVNAVTNYNSNIVFYEAGSVKWFWGYNAVDNRLRAYGPAGDSFSITDAGNVGIGTTSPSAKLFINGGSYATSLIIKGSASNSGIVLKDSDGNNDGFVYADSGNVGFLDSDGDWAIRASANTDARLYVGNSVKFMVDTNSRISLSNNDSGDDNTILGYNAGRLLASGGDDNVIIGHEAVAGGTGSTSFTGTLNVFMGYRAGYNQEQSPHRNVVIGAQAGDASQGGYIDSVFIGYASGGAVTSGDNNVAIGAYAGNAITSGGSNVMLGKSAGAALGAGESQNVIIGTDAMSTANEGTGSGNEIDDNIAIGFQSLPIANFGSTGSRVANRNIAIGTYALNSTGTNSHTGTVAIGYSSLLNLTSGTYNTAIGYISGKHISTGGYNTFLGYEAGANGESDDIASNTANKNVAVGYQSMGTAYGTASNHFTASHNVSMGYQSLMNLSSGGSNVALGGGAGSAVTTGSENILIGLNTGKGITTQGNNTYVGHAVASNASSNGHSNTLVGSAVASGGALTGNYNVAIGRNSLLSATSGNNNVIIGYNAGSTLTDTSELVCIGYESGKAIDHANAAGCTFLGYQSGKTITSAGHNTFLGYKAGLDADTGAYNTAVGSSCLENITGSSAKFNTAVGFRAGQDLTSGSSNILIGHQAQPSANDVTFEIVIGTTDAFGDKFVGGGTNTVRIGSDAEYMEGDLTSNSWSHGSDKRIKKDIKDSDLGLDFINDLRTVTFKKKAQSEYPQEFDQYNADKTERINPDKKHYGFIAQEVKEAMDKAGHSEFPVWKENRDGMQMLGEAELITPLIKAVQELSAKVKELEAKLSK